MIGLILVLLACAPGTDLDHDGFAAPADCDDEAPLVNPAATDPAGDGLDANCDGIDGVDADLDGFAGGAGGGEDCDDVDAAVHPGATDVAGDGVDQDCDGSDPTSDDVDGDGHLARSAGGDDCNDLDASIHPGADEQPYDGTDQDCDPTTRDDDLDGDGYGSAADCDDDAAGVHPGANDVCFSGADEDCADAGCVVLDTQAPARIQGQGGRDDYLGYAVAGGHDVTGDGLADVAASAWSDGSGAMYVFSTPRGELTEGSAASVLAGMGGVTVGEVLFLAPDADGNGVGELLVEVNDAVAVLEGPLDTTPLPDAWIVTGSPLAAGDLDGDGLADLVVESGSGFAVEVRAGPAWAEVDSPIASLTFSDQGLQTRTATVGDLDGDGLAEIALSNDIAFSRIDVYVVPGGTTGLLDVEDVAHAIRTDADWILGGSAVVVGDMNGDGYGELAVRVGLEMPYGTAVTLLFNGPIAEDRAPGEADAALAAVSFGEQYDSSEWEAAPGDVDGDGLADLAVALDGHSERDGTGEGRVYLVLGPVSGRMTLSESAAIIVPADDDLTEFGSVMAAAGDVDGDGLGDLVVGSALDTTGGAGAGAVSVFFGGLE